MDKVKNLFRTLASYLGMAKKEEAVQQPQEAGQDNVQSLEGTKQGG